jgi:acyl-CoA thioester hydrolase
MQDEGSPPAATAEELCAVLRVRFSEVDAQGLVFNSRYLEYIDAGFTEFMRARGILVAEPADRERFDTVLVKATLAYRAPARLDQLVEIWATVRRIGHSSIVVGFTIRGREDRAILVTAEMIYASYDGRAGTSVAVPDDIRALLEGPPIGG